MDSIPSLWVVWLEPRHLPVWASVFASIYGGITYPAESRKVIKGNGPGPKQILNNQWSYYHQYLPSCSLFLLRWLHSPLHTGPRRTFLEDKVGCIISLLKSTQGFLLTTDWNLNHLSPTYFPVLSPSHAGTCVGTYTQHTSLRTHSPYPLIVYNILFQTLPHSASVLLYIKKCPEPPSLILSLPYPLLASGRMSFHGHLTLPPLLTTRDPSCPLPCWLPH